MQTYGNQKSIIVNKRNIEQGETFTAFSQGVQQRAMQLLNGGALKLWLYMMRHQNSYMFALSQVDCAEWGIGKDAYHSGVAKLIELGYLKERSKHIFDFFDLPEADRTRQDNSAEIEELAALFDEGNPYRDIRKTRRAYTENP